MAEVSDYPEIVQRTIEHYAQFKPSVGEVDVEVVIDRNQGHFELLHNGWANGYRIHGAVIHIDIRDSKIWIQHDGTEGGVANDLVDAGVPKEHIVLAFQSPDMRKYTDFAVA
jgi:hypothetical protein